MRKKLSHICTALSIAALAVACSPGNGQVGTDRRAQGGGNRGTNERIFLRGCVQPAPSGEGYSLQHVVLVPAPEQPQGQETMEHPLIQRGSWVRLAAGNGMTDDLKHYLNNEVTVTGDIVNSGANTIGTSGQSAPRASVANGDAPSIAVEKVSKVADNCAGE